MTESKTPQAVLAKLADLEQAISESNEELARLAQKQDDLDISMEEERNNLASFFSQVAMIRWIVRQYEQPDGEVVEVVEPPIEPFIGDVEVVGERDYMGAVAAAPSSIKDQVYNAMSWLTPPIQAKAVAEAIGCDWRQVAPTFGALSKEGKIKPAANGGGWMRAGGLVLALLLGGAGAAQAQYVPAPNIYAPSNWPMLRMEQMMQQQTQPQPYQFGVGMPGSIYGGGRSCVFIPGTGEVCR